MCEHDLLIKFMLFDDDDDDGVGTTTVRNIVILMIKSSQKLEIWLMFRFDELHRLYSAVVLLVDRCTTN